jgi:fluoride ion exporter CrcB/FEX
MSFDFYNYLAAICVGASLGAIFRHQISKIAVERISKDPRLGYLQSWHTAGINITGSFILGGIFSSPLIDLPSATTNSSSRLNEFPSNTKMSSFGLKQRMKLLLGVGFCGSFTTFSTFSVDVITMLGRGDMIKACSYIIVNNFGGIAAAACGMSMARKLFH